MKNSFIFILLVISLSGKCQSENESPISITPYNEINGINTKTFTDIFQAKNGFLWFTTAQGLVRFDATSFKSFSQLDGFSNNMMNLQEDNDGNLWITLADGSIACFNPLNGTFKNLPIKFSSYNKPLSLGLILKIHFDKLNRMWAATSRGLVSINKITGNAEGFRVKDLDENDSIAPNLQHNYKVSDIYEDNKNKLWLATDDGLYCFDPSLNKMNRIGPEKVQTGLWNDYAYQRICKKGDSLYLGSWGGGLSVYDIVKHKFVILKFNLKKQKSGTDNIIHDIICKDSCNLWLASPDKGLINFNCKKKQFEYLRKEKNKLSIQQFLWNRLVKDKDENIWAINADGLIKITTTDYPFKFKVFPVTHSDNHIFYEVNDMWEDSSFRFVALGFADGLHVINKKTGKHKILPVDFLKAEEKVQFAEKIFKDSKNVIWIITADYVYQFDKHKQKLIKPIQPPPFTKQLPSNYFNGIAEDRSGNLWLSTGRNGVFIFNSTTLKYKHIIPFSTIINGVKEIAPIFSICSDKNGRIWLGSTRGFLGYSNGVSEDITEVKSKLASNKIWSLFSDSKGNVWVSTIKGLAKFNVNEHIPSVVKVFTTDDGLSSDLLTGLCEDKEGSIWCISNSTLKVFKLAPRNNQVTSFEAKDGINEPGSLIKMVHLNNDSIYLLCQGGIYSFCPSVLNNRKPSSNLVFSTITVNGLEKGFSKPKKRDELSLNPNENSIYFEFSAIDFKHPEEYTFAYKLVGYDDNWIDIGHRRSVSFNNLKGGHYNLFIKASSKRGVWDIEAISIPFFILTPFYLQWWFMLLNLAFVAILLLIYIRIRFARQKMIFELENKTHNLEKEKAKMQYESLRQHLNPHFLFNSLTSLSSLIRINQQLASDFLDGMSKIYRYILQSKDEELVPIANEINFIKTFVKLQTTRFGDGLIVTFSIKEEALYKQIVPVTLQNLIENAIKHNVIEADSPLVIDISSDSNYIIVKNNLQRKKFVETSNKQGMDNLTTLYGYLTSTPLIIEETESHFIVKIPLL